jgi:hypothetical protein
MLQIKHLISDYQSVRKNKDGMGKEIPLITWQCSSMGVVKLDVNKNFFRNPRWWASRVLLVMPLTCFQNLWL